MPVRIVITGAPASGKSEFIGRLKTDPRFDGFVFLDELARQLLEEDPSYRDRWSEFHREIYRRQVARENELADKSFITDRGTADAFAFHPETAADCGTTVSDEYERYDAVILLGSTAGLGEDFFKRDAVRTESAQQVLAIEKATVRVWRDHPNFRFIPANTDSEAKFRVFAETLLEFMRRPE